MMIKDALLALNEKGGSSPYAIRKYIEEKQKSLLPANFRKLLCQQLKNSAAKGKLIKVKASYKLADTVKKAVSAMKIGEHAKNNEDAAPPAPPVKDGTCCEGWCC
ncbi:histone H1-like [Apium graveolens]|uniref:histone H1-like n=1 Tax=Apium graveolens TaxID=4045 RepID=UPI003D7A4F03